MRTKGFIAFLLILFFMALSLDAEAQCAMCRRIAESNLNEGTTAVSRNLNDAIIYLMTIPYIVLGGLGYLFYKNLKQKRIEDKAILGN